MESASVKGKRASKRTVLVKTVREAARIGEWYHCGSSKAKRKGLRTVLRKTVRFPLRSDGSRDYILQGFDPNFQVKGKA